MAGLKFLKKNGGFDNSTVREFDLERYLGKWHEIARLDHRFERGLSGVSAEYSKREDGKIRVVNLGFNAHKDRKSVVVGKAKTTSQPGLLRVSFFLNFYSDYRILAIGDDYEWALVGAGKSNKHLWILAREDYLPDSVIRAILLEAEGRGYDTSKMIF